MTRALRLIETPEDVLTSERLLGQELRRLFVGRQRAAKELHDIDDRINELGRYLAKERGVAFIRVEQLRLEFGS
jgi:hypothetical protein